jgi:hypothetical protein
MSAATNSTPLLSSVQMKPTLRDRRSSLATMSLALSFLQAASAAAGSGRIVAALAALNLRVFDRLLTDLVSECPANSFQDCRPDRDAPDRANHISSTFYFFKPLI